MVVIRCFVIAVRYGYSSNLRYKVIREKSQVGSYLTKDLLIGMWVNLNPETLKAETDSAMWRN